MKKIILLCLIILITISQSGCTFYKQADNNAVKNSSDKTQDSIDSDNTNEGSVEMTNPNVQSMVPPVDALIRCCVENTFDYSTNDRFVWEALYYHLGANYSLRQDSITLHDDRIIVPKSIVLEYATSLFSDLTSLPPFPEEYMVGKMSYDEAADTYTVFLGDRGLSETVFVSSSQNADGTIEVIAELKALDEETDNIISQWNVTLKNNPYASGLANPIFYYSVSNMEMLVSDSSVTNIRNITGTFQGLEDNRTAVFSFQDGKEIVFRFYNDEVSDIFSTAAVGSLYTISYTIDKTNNLNIIYEISE